MEKARAIAKIAYTWHNSEMDENTDCVIHGMIVMLAMMVGETSDEIYESVVSFAERKGLSLK